MSSPPTTETSAENLGFTDIEVNKFSYVWIISNFSFGGEETGDSLKSPIFSSDVNDELKWHLVAHPQGDSEENTDYLSVGLVLASSEGDEVRAKFKMSILNTNREEKNVIISNVQRFNQGGTCGFPKFIRRDILFHKAYRLLTDDKLTLRCEISQVAASFNISCPNDFQSVKIPECSLSNDMEQLFGNQRFSDCTISVNGQEFFVHKKILASRSSVFAATFENEMKEKNNNRVEIPDVDAKVMKEMLHFIYTGKVSCVDKMAEDLFAVADKYALDRLKVICEEAICANLSIDTASSILVLADMHSADQLKARAIDFIICHVTEVMITSGWQTVDMQYPHLVKEVLCTASEIKKRLNILDRLQTKKPSYPKTSWTLGELLSHCFRA